MMSSPSEPESSGASTEQSVWRDESAPTAQRSIQGPRIGWWVTVHALALTLLAAGDVLAGEAALTGSTLFWVIGTAMAVGSVYGLGWGLAFFALRWIPGKLAAIPWLLAGIGAATWIIVQLGALERLGGAHSGLAIAAIAGGVIGGVALGVGALAFQPTRRDPLGFARRCRLVPRLLIAGGILVCGIGAIWMDRNVLVGQHPAAHLALRLATAWGLAFAVTVVSPRFPRRGWLPGTTTLVLAAGLATGSVLTLDAEDESELSAILDRPFSTLALEAARRPADFDGDGYSALLGGTDCDPFDPAVNPGAREIPGNGIDDNCRLGDAGSIGAVAEDVQWPAQPTDKSIVLITIDTVAAEHTSLYGRERDTTPYLSRWAKDAALFEKAYTSGGWTSLAISSLFRGVYPRRLRWTRLYETSKYRLLRHPPEPELQEGESLKQMFGVPLEDPRPPLPTWLSHRGMHTVAVTNDGHSEFLDSEFVGLGFDEYVDLDDMRKSRKTRVFDEHVTDAALQALDEMPDDEPYFLWVHYFGPHMGSSRHKGVEDYGKTPGDRYDHEILYMDGQVGRLIDRLEQDADARDLMIIVTSDHGELVSKTGREHGLFLWEKAIHVPMIIKGEGIEPGVYPFVVSLVDIYPTILEATNCPIPPGLDGVDLAPLTRNPESAPHRILLSETWTTNVAGERTRDKITAFDGKLKLIWNLISEQKLLHPHDRHTRNSANLLGDGVHDETPLRDFIEAYLEENGAPNFND